MGGNHQKLRENDAENSVRTLHQIFFRPGTITELADFSDGQ